MKKNYYLKGSLIKILLCVFFLIPTLKVSGWADGSGTAKEKTLKQVEKYNQKMVELIESNEKTQQKMRSLTTQITILTWVMVAVIIYQVIGDYIKKKLFDAEKRDKGIKKVKKQKKQ